MQLPVFDKYQVTQKAGSNICYTIWEAHDTTSGNRVFIRSLKPEFASDKALVSGFHERAHVLASLNHRGIYRVYRSGSRGANHFVVTEPTDSLEPLEVLIREEAPILADEIRTLLRNIYETIQYAHLNGVVHGLLNPRTIRIKGDGSVKLDAFDLAWYLPFILQSTSREAAYLARYIPPECNPTTLPDGRSDLYSIGATLYHLLTKRAPFHGETVPDVRKSQRRMPPLNLEALGFPPALEVLVRDSIAPDSRERVQNIGQVVRLLGQFNESISERAAKGDSATKSDGEPLADLEFLAQSTAPRPRSKALWVVVATVFTLLLAALFLVRDYQDSPVEPENVGEMVQDSDGSGNPETLVAAIEIDDESNTGNGRVADESTQATGNKSSNGNTAIRQNKGPITPDSHNVSGVEDLQKTPASLLVKAEGLPVQANIFVDEKFMGETGADGRFEMPGLVLDRLYEVKVTKEGYTSKTRALLVDANMNLLIFDLKQDDIQVGTVIFQAEPGADSVFVDGELRGLSTPLELKLKWGTHTVRLINTKLGNSWGDEFSLKVGQILRIRHDFGFVETGKVAISLKNAAEYGFGYVYVDDKLWDGRSNTTPLEIELPVGKHKIQVQRQGFTAWPPETLVNVRAGETVHTAFRLTEQ
jgi:serine/threonine protein kinase